jgi:glutathione S-transferase
MEYVAIVTALALLEYMYIAYRVGAGRIKYGVPAPAVSGNPTWERLYRVQTNTVEQLVIFLPALWIFAHLGSPVAAAALGLVFVVARAIYLVSYVKNPDSRTLGFVLGFFANVVLVIGVLVQAIRGVI